MSPRNRIVLPHTAFCVERQHYGSRLLYSARLARSINPRENAPPGIFDALEPEITTTREDIIYAGALLTKKKWSQGARITVAFLNGTAEEQKFIREACEEGLEEVNLKVQWVTSFAAAAIRIRYAPAAGSWSYMAADALAVPANEPTIQISHLNKPLIRHEFFGHAVVGMLHEHQHPARPFEFDPEPTYALWGGPPNNWSREQIDREVIYKYPREQSNFGEFDPESIMAYTISNDVTIGDFEIAYNAEISAKDREFARREYPPSGDPTPPNTNVALWQDIGYFDDQGIWKAGTGPRGIGRAYLQPMPDGTVRAVPWNQTLYG